MIEASYESKETVEKFLVAKNVTYNTLKNLVLLGRKYVIRIGSE